MALAVLSALQASTSIPPTEAVDPAVPMATTLTVALAPVKPVMQLVPPVLGPAHPIVSPAIANITLQEAAPVQPVTHAAMAVLAQATPNAVVVPLESIQFRALLRPV